MLEAEVLGSVARAALVNCDDSCETLIDSRHMRIILLSETQTRDWDSHKQLHTTALSFEV
jgi:hypothetical protein